MARMSNRPSPSGWHLSYLPYHTCSCLQATHRRREIDHSNDTARAGKQVLFAELPIDNAAGRRVIHVNGGLRGCLQEVAHRES